MTEKSDPKWIRDLVDEGFALDRQKKAIEKKLERIKTKLKAYSEESKRPRIEGSLGRVIISKQELFWYDPAKVWLALRRDMSKFKRVIGIRATSLPDFFSSSEMEKLRSRAGEKVIAKFYDAKDPVTSDPSPSRKIDV